MKRSLLLLVVLLAAWGETAPARGQGVYFDDAGPDIMRLGNDTHYEVAFHKSNGSIAYITDKSTGQHVSPGSRYGCFWGAVFPGGTPEFVGGCNFDAAWSNRFTYAWSASSHTLTLTYTPDPAGAQKVAAQVVVQASTGPWFDLRLQLQNNRGLVLDYVLFPCDTVFVEAEIQEALLPVLPGIILEPAFFQQNRTYTASYPGYPGLFADYVSLLTTQGQIAIYARYGEGPIRPAVIGFVHDDEYIADSTYYYHTFGARVGHGATWTSPWMRVRVSQSHRDTIQAYRTDNGLDRFRSLPEKLGARYLQTVRSPLYKADAAQLAVPFAQYPALLAQVPTPGILHPVAFQPGGHDESYPDFLPPAPAWGTTADFAAMFQQTQALGFLVMPYTNPTWWDDGSPTLQNLTATLTISDLAVLDGSGMPVHEYYGVHGGYVMSPYPPFVRQRLGQLMHDMTATVPSDMVFEDQIGARPWLFDHNPSSPYPMAYMQGWLEHTRAYSDALLMTELGFDRLAETEVGFHGSVLLPERFGYTPGWWGTGTWRPYPLAPLMVRDKVLFYQHDLAPETMTADKARLSWNLALGYMLSYDLVATPFGGGLRPQRECGWLRLVGEFQKHVLARYAGERMTDYARVSGNVTRTSFETCSVIANWDATNPYTTGGHTLPPQGVLVTCAGDQLMAGVFTAYNGVPLSAGDHYLIEERGWTDLTVRQPLGADTGLTLKPLPGWSSGSPTGAWAYTAAGQVIESVPFTRTQSGLPARSQTWGLAAQSLTFVYQQERGGKSVAYYRFTGPANTIFLPLVLKSHAL